MKNKFKFEKFNVYIKSEHYYSVILNIISNTKIDKNIKDQLKRASLSIVLNIAEGSGKYTKKDKKNFYIISRGSVNECVAILRILNIENKISKENFNKTYEYLLEIAKMLSALIKSIDKRQ